MDLPCTFGRYILEERIGAGGMAEVFRARLVESGFEKAVCIKRILPGLTDKKGFMDMFRDEAALAAKLSHPNVVTTFDFGEHDGVPFLAMELVDGASLARVLVHHRKVAQRIGVAQVLSIGVALCRGLHHAHTLSVDGVPLRVVHRDVTPSNILISREGTVKLADFGIARASLRETKTHSGVMKGKVGYLAPEQTLGLPGDHRIDQFATGIVLWESLCLDRLFSGRTDYLTLDAVTHKPIAPPSAVRDDVPPEVDAIVLRCLERNAGKRFAHMLELEQELSRALLKITRDPADQDLRPLVTNLLDVKDDSPPTNDDLSEDEFVATAPLQQHDGIESVPTVVSVPAAQPPPPRAASRAPWLVASVLLFVTAILFGWRVYDKARTPSFLVVDPAKLINIDTGGPGGLGPAAVGASERDVWTPYYRPWTKDGVADPLIDATGKARFGWSLTIENAPGNWGFTHGNSMFGTYLYPHDKQPMRFTFKGLAKGTYDLYAYGHASSDEDTGEDYATYNATFSLESAGKQFGPLSTLVTREFMQTEMRLGTHYVVFRDVFVDGPMILTALPGQSAHPVLNGLQLVGPK